MNRKLATTLLTLLVCLSFLSVFCSEAQEPVIGGKGNISFMPSQIPLLNVSYANGVFDFIKGMAVQVQLTADKATYNLSLASSVLGSAKIAPIIQKNKENVHYGLNISGLAIASANRIDDFRFKLLTKERVDYDSFIDEVTGFNVSVYSVPRLNLEFRFNDLQESGFNVSALGDGVKVEGVKGKTAVLLDPIVYSAPTITVTGYSAAVPCTFYDLWNASSVLGWNVVNYDLTDTVQSGFRIYNMSCKVVVGDGTSASYFNDTDKQVIFSHGIVSATSQYLIRCYNPSIVTFGVSMGNYLSRGGCDFFVAEATYWVILFGGSGQFLLYSCSADSPSVSANFDASNSTNKRWHFLGRNTVTDYSVWTGETYDMTLCTGGGFNFQVSGSTIRCMAVGGNTMFRMYDSTNGTLRDVVGVGQTDAAGKCGRLSGSGVTYLVDCMPTDWTFQYVGGSHTRKTYRQYSFDLTVTYPNNTAVNSANVTLTKNSVVVYSALTNSSGMIATQTLTYGYYNQTGGNIIYDNGDYTLTITSNYGNYSKVFALTEKTKWQIALTASLYTEEDLNEWLFIGGMLAAVTLLGVAITLYILRRRQ